MAQYVLYPGSPEWPTRATMHGGKPKGYRSMRIYLVRDYDSGRVLYASTNRADVLECAADLRRAGYARAFATWRKSL